MAVSSADDLLKDIEAAFPFVEMPLPSKILAHGSECNECSDFSGDLENLREAAIDGKAIRTIHQEMSHMSAEGWRWILPHYLRYCLTAEAAYNQFETEFLIYNLGPEMRFQQDTGRRLALASETQLLCLSRFLEWCLEDDNWKTNYADNINRAISFLKVLIAEKSRHSA